MSEQPWVGLMAPGDHLHFLGQDGVVRRLVVTSGADVCADGTVTFQAADAEAHAAVERLRYWPARDSWPPSGYLCSAGGCPGHVSKWLRCSELPEHRAARQRTDDEQAALQVDGSTS